MVNPSLVFLGGGIGVGVLDGVIPFSSFSLETVLMLERQTFGAAAGYVATSVVLPRLGVMPGSAVSRTAVAA